MSACNQYEIIGGCFFSYEIFKNLEYILHFTAHLHLDAKFLLEMLDLYLVIKLELKM